MTRLTLRGSAAKFTTRKEPYGVTAQQSVAKIGADSYDYYNRNLRNVINIGHDACNIIISKRREREEIEAYSPISNYRIPKDYLEQP